MQIGNNNKLSISIILNIISKITPVLIIDMTKVNKNDNVNKTNIDIAEIKNHLSVLLSIASL